jgi:hypothetical protein
MSLPALPPFSPLGLVLADVEHCIEAKLYYPALLIALTIPEICSGLALDKSVFVKKSHYEGFIDKYTPMTGSALSGTLCYQLRGGVVHRANLAGHPEFPASHVIFSIPETGLGIHGVELTSDLRPGESATTFDLVKFCRTIVAAAYKWYEDYKDDPLVAKNMKNLIRYCPDGIRGFVKGAPIVGSGE